MKDLIKLGTAFYPVPRLDDIRESHEHNERSELTMPVALAALFEAEDFVDCIRNAVSVGGDCDTIAAIAGSIAEPLFGIPEETWAKAATFLDNDIYKVVEEFYPAAEHIRAKEEVRR